MPTIDDLIVRMETEKKEAQEYHQMALNVTDNPDLKNFLSYLAEQEEQLASALQTKIDHLLEIEKW